MMMRNDIALSGLGNFNLLPQPQGFASLHPGLWVLRAFSTNYFFIVSVKGGENVGVTMVKDLIATVEHEKAAIGLFVTLAEPTAPMTTEAVSAGFYNNPDLRNYQKIQILTIEGLLNGTM